MVKITSLIVFGLLFAFFLISSCRHTTDENGIPIIIQHRYWNYYERGIAYSIVNKWEKAAADFQIAMGKKKGALYPEYEDTRWNKTYGMHVIQNYFPHRELGICHFFLKNMDAAEKELQISLKMTPSARAKFYLNKVLSAKLTQVDMKSSNPIQIAINFPQNVPVFNQTTIKIKGTVQSPFQLNDVRVNGRRELIELARETIPLNTTVLLEPGSQTLIVSARDLAGNSRNWKRDIIIDVESPTIGLSPHNEDPENTILVSFKDEHEIDRILIDDKVLPSPDYPSSHSIELPIYPPRQLDVEAIDKAGNCTRMRMDTKEFQQAALNRPREFLLNQYALLPKSVTYGGRTQTALTRSDAQFALLSGKTPSKRDQSGPRVVISPKIPGDVSVTTSNYVLDLMIEDDSYLDSTMVGINKRRIVKTHTDSKNRKIRFTRNLDLVPGNNNVLIRAEDQHGNVSYHRFRIFRKMPFDKFHEYRMTLTSHVKSLRETFVSNRFFNSIYEMKIQKVLALDFAYLIDQAILDQKPIRFNVLERDRDTISQLLFEHKIAHSSLKDYEFAVNHYSIRNAEWFLRGSISLRGGGESENWVLDGALVDVRNGTPIARTDAYFEGRSADAIDYSLRIFVNKLIQQLPLYSAAVQNLAQSNKIVVPLGTIDNIKPNFRFMFVSQEAEHLLYADPLESDDGKWIQGIVSSIMDNQCVLEVIPKGAVKLLKKNDAAFVR